MRHSRTPRGRAEGRREQLQQRRELAQRHAELDDDEDVLLTSVTDHAALTLHLRAGRRNSIIALRDKHKAANLYSDEYFKARN